MTSEADPAAEPPRDEPTRRHGEPTRLRIPITIKVLVVLVVVASVSAGLVTRKLISFFTEDKTNYIRDAGNDIAVSTSASLDLLFGMYRQQLLSVAETFDRDAEPGDGLSAYMRSSPQCIFLGIYDENGEQVLSVHRRSQIEAASLEVDAYVAQREQLELIEWKRHEIVARNASASTELLSFSVTLPFQSVTYDTRLFLYAEFLAGPALRLVRQSTGLDVYVLDANGELFAHADPELMAAHTRPPTSDYLSELLPRAEQTGSAMGEFRKGDASEILAWQMVGEVGAVSVIVERAKEDAVKAMKAVSRNSFVASLQIVAVAVLLSLFVSRALTQRLLALRAAAQRLERGVFDVDLPSGSNDEIGDLGRSINLAAAGLKERSQLSEQVKNEQDARKKLERYHSPGVIERILASGHEADTLNVHKLDVSVAFTDLVGFTSMSESLEPDELCSILNEFFTEMTEHIFRYHGTLDKYIGDCIMFLFGAPVAQSDHAVRCVCAALAMHRSLEQLNLRTAHDFDLKIRTAINSGPVIAGDIGSPKRKDYSVLGDTVNIASRLESSVAKPGQIVIGESTYEAVKGQFKIAELGMHELRGKKRKMRVYEVLGTL